MTTVQWVEYIVLELKRFNIRHEVHHFPSGCKMIDIWNNNKFYCVQLEPTRIGISELTEDNPGFDTIPDKVFETSDEFKTELKKVLGKE